MKQCWFTLKDMHTSIRKDFLAQIANQTDFYQILIDPLTASDNSFGKAVIVCS